MNGHTGGPPAGMTMLVIGGTSGIGESIARQAAELGASVMVTGRDEERLARAAEQPWVRRTSRLDAHDDAALDRFFADLEPLDHLVSMVGDSMAGGFLHTTPETMRQVWHSKFWANWRIGQLSQRTIRSGGSLTFTAGTGGRPHEISATYVANLGIGGLTEGLAAELAPDVRVNAVAPTFLGTHTRFWSDRPIDELRREETNFARFVPLRRIGTVDDVASTYVHLITNSYITGQIVAVDGGVMLQK